MTILYHGTSTRLGELKTIKPVSETKVFREFHRQNEKDVVFLTDSLRSAKRYAQLAVETFSGLPIVYQVIENDSITEIRPHEFTAKYADVEKAVK